VKLFVNPPVRVHLSVGGGRLGRFAEPFGGVRPGGPGERRAGTTMGYSGKLSLSQEKVRVDPIRGL